MTYALRVTNIQGLKVKGWGYKVINLAAKMLQLSNSWSYQLQTWWKLSLRRETVSRSTAQITLKYVGLSAFLKKIRKSSSNCQNIVPCKETGLTELNNSIRIFNGSSLIAACARTVKIWTKNHKMLPNHQNFNLFTWNQRFWERKKYQDLD